MSRTILGSTLVLLIAALGLAAAVRAQEDEGTAVPPESPPPIHPAPGVAIERLIDCTRSAVGEDREALLRALQRIEDVCRNIHDPRDERYSSRLIEIDWGFHRALEVAIQRTAAGDMNEAFQQYQWVERGCRLCHVQAAADGLYAPDRARVGTLGGPGEEEGAPEAGAAGER